jgi:mono/diheme cytochrome c family protein
LWGPMKSELNLVRSLWLVLAAVVLVVGLAFASESGWEKKVPEADKARANPVANDPDAVAAGGKLYTEKCAKCHGETAEGKGHHPSLRTQSVQQATPGELEWLIQHGNRWHMMPAMPSFASLPETQRWQIVSYIKSLPTQGK